MRLGTDAGSQATAIGSPHSRVRYPEQRGTIVRAKKYSNPCRRTLRHPAVMRFIRAATSENRPGECIHVMELVAVNVNAYPS